MIKSPAQKVAGDAEFSWFCRAGICVASNLGSWPALDGWGRV